MKRSALYMSMMLVLVLFTSCEEYGSIGVEQQTLGKSQPEHIVSGMKGSAMMQKTFRTHLAGDAEVPSVDTRAQGQATFKVSSDGTSITYKLIAANIENVLMAHIHMAPAGENGQVVVWLYPPAPPPQLKEGRFEGVLADGVITADNLMGPLKEQSLARLIEAMKSGNTYVNVHTEQHRGGEIRGQIF